MNYVEYNAELLDLITKHSVIFVSLQGQEKIKSARNLEKASLIAAHDLTVEARRSKLYPILD